MYAVTIPTPGGPDVLTWTEVPDPQPRADEVVINVAATSINRADAMQRDGNYPVPPGASPYPGLECSGTIVALGADVTGWAVGDEACALLTGGGYAEQVAVPAGQLLPIPAGVDLVSAGALAEVLCTVWSNVVMLAGLRSGQTLLVHGGSGGIGTAAIQMGVAIGATVIATSGSAAKVQHSRELGASVGIDYTRTDFVEEVRAATDGRGVDVVLDVVGAAYLQRNVEVLAPGGHVVIIGLQKGRKGELDLSALMAKRGSISGTTLRGRPAAEKAAIVAEVREHVWPMVERGDVRVVVDRTFPLADAAAAHRRFEERSHLGKIILTA